MSFDDLLMRTGAIVFIGAIVLFILGAIGNAVKMDELNQQCIADGHKNYECYSMLHVRGQ
jgi:hypothetical protein